MISGVGIRSRRLTVITATTLVMAASMVAICVAWAIRRRGQSMRDWIDNRRLMVDMKIMILRFRHKGLERLFTHGDASGVNPQLAAKLRRMLILLDRGTEPAALNAPGYRLHPLRGDRAGQWSAWVSGNWRLVFEFDGEDATNVDLIDYH